MMENKYYTPKVSELYIGFECQILSQALTAVEIGKMDDYAIFGTKYDPNSELCFIPHKITDKDILYLMNPHMLKKEVRVKYLDKPDIESLGWKEFSNNRFDRYEGDEVIGKRFFLDVSKFSDGQIYNMEITEEEWDNSDPYDKQGGLRTLFNGMVKNKSALKILMEQIWPL